MVVLIVFIVFLLLLHHYILLIKEVEEEVAGNPVHTHATGKADRLLLGIGHLAVVDADVAQQIALAVTHGAVGVDVTDTVALGIKNLQFLDDSHSSALDAAHGAIGVK